MKALKVEVTTPTMSKSVAIPVMATKRNTPPVVVCVFEGSTQAPMILDWDGKAYKAHGWVGWVPLIEPEHIEALIKGKGIILNSTPKVVVQPFLSEEALKNAL